LIDLIKSLKPDVIVISGDITMRARKNEFIAAKAFLDRLPFPQIIVPGNHDIPLYNVYSRFFQALKKYKHYITEDLEPVYKDESMVIYGLNTARSFALVRGRVDLSQIKKICAEFDKLPREVLRVVVTHHPFDLPENFRAHNLQWKPALAMGMLINSKVDIFLGGHTHKSLVDHVPSLAKSLGYDPLIIQAGTSTSVRTRREAFNNSFNIIHVDYPEMQIENYFWDKENKVFSPNIIKNFTHTEKGWRG
jgi:3',5'-cyclic AMP phosphodiesterase CpdA